MKRKPRGSKAMDTKTPKTIGEIVRARKDLALSSRDLARLAGLSIWVLYNLEQGRTKLTPTVAEQLAAGLAKARSQGAA